MSTTTTGQQQPASAPLLETNITMKNNISNPLDAVEDMSSEQETATVPHASVTVSSSSPAIHLRWAALNKTISAEVQSENKGTWAAVSALFGTKKTKTEKKQILFDLAGHVKPGELVAIMGPSGSGKTTLLSVLGGRTAYEGIITINGRPLNKSMKRHTAYVLQEDIFFDLTVKQQLLFTAQLRLPESLSYQDKLDRVHQVIHSLGLTKVMDSRISLISGGEKKRTNIATELLTDPSLILLDEPTSGLDSTSAVRLIRLLKDLANQGKTIITSIHQPSSQVYESFDRLILLADGKMVYYGPPKDSSAYFASLGFPCPLQYNPADHIMDIVQHEDVKAKAVAAFTYPPEILETSAMMSKYLTKKDELQLEDATDPNLNAEELPKFATGFWTQLKVLLYRTALNKRGSVFTWLNFIQAIGLAIVCGLVWFRMPLNINYITERGGFIFFLMTFWPLYSIFMGLLAYPAERSIINKERASGSYRISAYFLAKTLAETPLLIILPTAFLLIAYWMTGLNPRAGAFFGILAVEIIAVSAGEGIGLFIGSSASDIETGMVIATVSLLTMLLVAGFFAENIPAFFAWLKYLSLFYYAFMACQTFELGTGDVVLECDETSKFNNILPSCQTGKTVSGMEVLEKGLKVDTNLGFTIGMLVVIWCVFRFAAYMTLRYVRHGIVRT